MQNIFINNLIKIINKKIIDINLFVKEIEH